MKNLRFISLSALLITSLLISCNELVIIADDIVTKPRLKITSIIEQAYFEGQRDALRGDIRIKKNNDSCWVWNKSCWDSGRQPTFNPSIVCGDNK